MIFQDWKLNDYRIINFKQRILYTVNNEVVVDSTITRIYKIELYKNKLNYDIINVSNLSPSNLNMIKKYDDFDSAKEELYNYLDDLSKIHISFDLKVSKKGEFIKLIDPEWTFDDFIEEALSISDTFGIQEEYKDFLSELFYDDFKHFRNFEEELISDIMYVLDFYGLDIPKESPLIQTIEIKHPLTNATEEIDITYKTSSIENNIYCIQFQSNGDENIEDENSRINAPVTIYWNSNTTWIDKIDGKIEFINDTIYSVVETKINLEKKNGVQQRL